MRHSIKIILALTYCATAVAQDINLPDFGSPADSVLNKTEDWDSFYSFCSKNNVDIIITLGDSRIDTKNIVNNFEVIGNKSSINFTNVEWDFIVYKNILKDY